MRMTLTLTVDEDLAQFIQHQPGMMDASAFINQLLHDACRRRGIYIDNHLKAKIKDDVNQAAELILDESTHSAS